MFNSGERIFLPGSSGEPSGMIERIVSTPGVEVLTSFVAGVNRLPPAWAPGVAVRGPFAFPGTGYAHLPLSYAAMTRHVATTAALDSVVVQVSPPDRDGNCSLGPAAEFSVVALARGGRRIAVVNAASRAFARSPRVPIASFDRIVETEGAIATYDIGEPDASAIAIADAIAGFVEDGAALQTGLGKVPSALMRRLGDRRGLRLHSGMLSDAVMALADGGALDSDWRHATTVFLGTPPLYAWAARQDMIHVLGCEVTHDPRFLASIEGMIAVNSALEVDLLGQCNLEVANGRQASGGGGVSDFARAARLGGSGLSIIALPATAGDGRSRIRPRLGAEGIVTLARNDIDLIVTEHGVADLRGRDVHARAEAIVAIAAPPFRAVLDDEWRHMAKTLGF